MEPLSLQDICAAIDATPSGGLDGSVEGVCTDSRQDCQGRLFVALKGENTDGHRYVSVAARAGAAAALVSHVDSTVAIPQLVVPDTLLALGRLARFYARRFSIPRIAVTGSVGKTSVRSMIATILSGRMKVHESARNHNNEIGVPLTLLGLEPAHDVAVIEMAMRGKGQIAYLCSLAEPTIGVITNIGVSHIELLGSRDGIADAKAELLDALPGDGAAVLPADDDYLDFLLGRAARRGIARVLTFGSSVQADFRCTDVRMDGPAATVFRINGVPFVLPSAGAQHPTNAAAACAVASQLGVTLEEAADRLRHWRLPEMRLNIREAPRGILVLDDTYNAAPDSMKAALQTLAHMAGAMNRRAVAVLGDMKELGGTSEEAHENVGRLPAMASVTVLITVGHDASRIAASAPSEAKHHFADSAEAAPVVPSLLEDGDLVLVKGSRAMAMERVVEAIIRTEELNEE